MQVQVLQEGSRSKELGYHFTDLASLAQILKTDCLFATNSETETNTKVPTWSYTRKKDGFGYRNLNEPVSVRIALDIDKISNNFKVIPYSFVEIGKNDKSFEYEERVLGKPIKQSGKWLSFMGEKAYGLPQVHKYIKEITLNSFVEKAMNSKEYMTVDPSIVTDLSNYNDRFEVLRGLLEDISKCRSAIFLTKSEVIQSGSVSAIVNWLEMLFKRFKAPNSIFESSKLNYFLTNDLSDIFEIHNRYWKLIVDFCLYYDKNILHNHQENDLGLSDFKNKLEALKSSGDLYSSVSDREREDNSDFMVQRFIDSFSVLKQENGRSITSVQDLRTYLQNLGIELTFSNGYDDRNARYVYKEEFRDKFNRLNKMIDTYISYLSIFKFNFTEFKNTLGFDYRHYLKYLRFRTFRPELKTALHKFITVTGQETFIRNFTSELGLKDSDRIFLAGMTSKSSNFLIPVFIVSDVPDSIASFNFNDLRMNKALLGLLKNLGYSSRVQSVSVKEFINRFCKFSSEVDSESLNMYTCMLAVKCNNKIKKYFLSFEEQLGFFEDNRPIIPIILSNRISLMNHKFT